MRDDNTNLNEKLQNDKDFKIELLNSQRKMKEIAEESYRRIAVDLYDLDIPSQENEIELQTTGKSSK